MTQLSTHFKPSLANLTGEALVSSFRDTVRGFLESSGLTMRHVTARHGELLKSTDETVALGSVKLAYQLHGMNDEQQSQQSGDIVMQINIVTPETKSQ